MLVYKQEERVIIIIQIALGIVLAVIILCFLPVILLWGTAFLAIMTAGAAMIGVWLFSYGPLLPIAFGCIGVVFLVMRGKQKN